MKTGILMVLGALHIVGQMPAKEIVVEQPAFNAHPINTDNVDHPDKWLYN